MACENCKTCEDAIKNGHYKCVGSIHFKIYDDKWGMDYEYGLYEHYKEVALAAAAEQNHLECVKILMDNGYEYCGKAGSFAASSGHIDIIKYFHGQGCKFNSDIINSAIIGNQYECMEYLRKIGCPWDDQSFYYAVLNEDAKFVKYACENGCKLYENCLIKILHKKASHTWVVVGGCCRINPYLIYNKLFIRCKPDNYINLIVNDIFNIICHYCIL